MKRIVSLLLLVLLLMLFACDDPHRYKGKYPEFFSIAVDSLLGVRGSEGDDISVIDEDGKGRTLFSYRTNSNLEATGSTNNFKLYSIMICQKFDDSNAYKYDDINFIVADSEDLLTEERILALKEINDWGKDINEDLLVKISISRNKCQSKIDNSMIIKAYKDITGGTITIREYELLTIDSNGRHLFFIKNGYMMMLYKDGTYDEEICLKRIDDLWAYQNEIKEFKVLNNWNGG